MVERRKDSKNRVLRTGESERKSGGYQYRWTTPDKKRHTVYAPSLKKLREKEAVIQRDLADGICTHSSNTTVDDVYKTWKTLKNGVKESTFLNQDYNYNHFVKKDFGSYKVASIRKSDVCRFYKNLITEKQLSLGTVKIVHSILNQIFELAKDDDLIRKNPCEKALKEFRKKYTQEERKALTRQEQDIFINFLKTDEQYQYIYPFFAVMLGTGMRAGEITGLRWEDIDFEKNIINVTHTLVYIRKALSGKKSNYVIHPPKTKAGYRAIPMTESVKQAFVLEKERQTENGLNCVSVIDDYTNFVFLNRDGGVRDSRLLNLTLKRIIKKCNQDILDKSVEKDPVLLPPFSCHVLRHTFATRLCESGMNIKVIQDVLGHSNIQVTLDIYTDVTDEFKQKEFKEFDDIL